MRTDPQEARTRYLEPVEIQKVLDDFDKGAFQNVVSTYMYIYGHQKPLQQVVNSIYAVDSDAKVVVGLDQVKVDLKISNPKDVVVLAAAGLQYVERYNQFFYEVK